MNQAYSRLSATHGHITDCQLDSVVYVGVSVVIFQLRVGKKPDVMSPHRHTVVFLECGKKVINMILI